MPHVKIQEYRCRDCAEVTIASFAEIEFGRVVCAKCGGTCDPTDAALAAQSAIRLRKTEGIDPQQVRIDEEIKNAKRERK